MTRFTIRRAAPEGDDERRAILGLLRQLDELHGRLQPDYFRPIEEQGQGRSERSLRRAVDNPDATLLVAEARRPMESNAESNAGPGPGLAGLVHLRVYGTPPSPILVPARRAYVEDLIVVPWARRGGCGRALMEAGLRWARERGAGQLVLTVWAGNHAAEAFYRSLGYEPLNTVLGIKI